MHLTDGVSAMPCMLFKDIDGCGERGGRTCGEKGGRTWSYLSLRMKIT